ncbi:MAG: hypothetical protein ACO3UM_07310, partial [Planctomycetota bacterium]
MFRHPLAAALGLLALALQAPIAAQGVIRDGPAYYRVGAISSSQADSVACDFSADPALPDVLVQNWWHYRVEGDSDERAFRDDGQLLQNYDRRHADLTWPNVDQRGLFRADISYDIFRTASESARVYNRLTIINTSGRVLRISLFHYIDLAPCVLGPESAVGGLQAQAFAGICPNSVVAVENHFPDRFEVAARDGTECGILAPGPAQLANTGLPFTGGDSTSAAQWDLVLPIGEQFTVWTSIWHNPTTCPAPQVENYGIARAGSRGYPRITGSLPIAGQGGVITVSNGLPNAMGVMVFGFGRIQIPIGPMLLQVLAGPRGIDFDSFVIGLDARGSVDLVVPLPGTGDFCARPINWQCFLVDPG